MGNLSKLLNLVCICQILPVQYSWTLPAQLIISEFRCPHHGFVWSATVAPELAHHSLDEHHVKPQHLISLLINELIFVYLLWCIDVIDKALFKSKLV